MESVIATIDEGYSALSQVISEKGQDIFCKNWKYDRLSKIKNLENKIMGPLLRDAPFLRHINRNATSSEICNKEYKTWSLWKDSGLNVLDLVEKGNLKIKYKFLPNAISYRRLLNNDTSQLEFGNFLDVYNEIRQIAKNRNDSDFLHSDPHLANFLYSTGNKKVIPIDSGVVLNRKMSFEELDSNLMARTLKDISELKIPREDSMQYIRSFKEIMSNEDVDNVLNLNYKSSVALKMYFAFREEVAHRIKKRGRLPSQYDFSEFENNSGLVRSILLE